MKGVMFGTKHSYQDFGLILKSKDIPAPEPKIITVDIPGAHGALDMSTVLTNGETKFQNRKLQFVFTMTAVPAQWEARKSVLLNALHGKKMQVILDEDSGFYYSGRCKVAAFQPDRRLAEITLEVDADPYKYRIAEYNQTFIISSSRQIVITNDPMRVWPTFTTASYLNCVFNGVTYGLSPSTRQITGLSFTEGTNTLQVSGNGDLQIRFRGGML